MLPLPLHLSLSSTHNIKLLTQEIFLQPWNVSTPVFFIASQLTDYMLFHIFPFKIIPGKITSYKQLYIPEQYYEMKCKNYFVIQKVCDDYGFVWENVDCGTLNLESGRMLYMGLTGLS